MKAGRNNILFCDVFDTLLLLAEIFLLKSVQWIIDEYRSWIHGMSARHLYHWTVEVPQQLRHESVIIIYFEINVYKNDTGFFYFINTWPCHDDC